MAERCASASPPRRALRWATLGAWHYSWLSAAVPCVACLWGGEKAPRPRRTVDHSRLGAACRAVSGATKMRGKLWFLSLNPLVAPGSACGEISAARIEGERKLSKPRGENKGSPHKLGAVRRLGLCPSWRRPPRGAAGEPDRESSGAPCCPSLWGKVVEQRLGCPPPSCPGAEGLRLQPSGVRHSPSPWAC